MPRISLPSSVPPSLAPRDLESRAEFTSRFLSSRAIQASTEPAFKKARMADAVWMDAKRRSMVSVKNAAGEWLMF
jgi:hypothetical protein